METTATNKSNKGKLIAGSFLIILGLLFILDNYGMMSFYISEYLFRWETYLFVIGIILIVSKSNLNAGVILILISLFFFGLDTSSYNFSRFIFHYWPIMVILFGFYILYKKSEDKKIEDEEEVKSQKENAPEVEVPNINRSFIFTDEKMNVSNPKFSFGDWFLLFSSIKIFFSKEQTNKSILLDNTLMLSSLEIRIPSNWKVVNNCVNIIGEVKDLREKNLEVTEEKPVTVILKGMNLLGEIKIREL